MTQAKTGDTVKVHYTGKLEDGSVFDSSNDKPPLEFTLGEQRVIKGFEDGVMGMAVGDSKTIEIPCEEAYGPSREEMIIEVTKDQFPPDITPEVGQGLELRQEDGQSLMVMVTDVSEEYITLDANHPLAGKDLTFDIELVAIA